MHYRVRIYNLNNKSNSPIEINFEAGWLKARLYAMIGTFIMYKHYYRHVELDARSEVDSYDVVFFDKKTGKDLIGLSVDQDESIDNFSYSL